MNADSVSFNDQSLPGSEQSTRNLQGGYFLRRWSTWAGLANGCSVLYGNAWSLLGYRR